MSKNKNFVVFVNPQRYDLKNLNNRFTFDIYDLSTGFCTHENHDLMKFLESPPEFFKTSVKGMVFKIDGFIKNDRIINYKLFEHVIAKLNSHQISFRFIYNFYIDAMCQLIAAKIEPKKDKIIYQFTVLQELTNIKKFVYNNTGYSLNRVYSYKHSENIYMFLDISVPFKAIISSATCVPNSNESTQVAKIQQALRAYNPIVLKEHPKKYIFQGIKIIIDQIVDGRISKFFILPSCTQVFWIKNNCKRSFDLNDKSIIRTSINELLPSTKSCIVPRIHKTFYMMNTNNETIQPHKVTTECHRIQLIINVDINENPTITHKAIILPRIQKLPRKLTKNAEKTEKLPIIGFFDNFSVICLWNEKENCYRFMDSWNGKFGKDLFLNFMLPKPRLASSSTEITSSSGVVYDLIKIVSMPSNEIKVDRNWKFTFTKDVENPVLLEFDTAEDGRKAASPAFLMALILKQHLKAIRKAIGDKPAKIAIRLLDDFENAETKKRVEAGLQEACEMLKLGCFFV